MKFLRRHSYLMLALLAGPVAVLATHPVITKAVETFGH